jgi:outer membrane protein OmpA-like peptidoglycan-associated protein
MPSTIATGTQPLPGATVDTVSSRLFHPPVHGTQGPITQPPPAVASPRRGRAIGIVIASCVATAVLAVVLTKSCSKAPPAEPVARAADAAVTRVAEVVAVVPPTPPPEKPLLPPAETGSLADLVGDRLKPKPKAGSAKQPPGAGSASRVKTSVPRDVQSRVGSAAPPASRDGVGSAAQPEPAKAEEPPPPVQPKPKPRVPVHVQVRFPCGDFSSSSVPEATVRRLQEAFLADPSRRVIVTGHAEDNERGVLETVARSRANAVKLRLSGGVNRIPHDQIEVSSSTFIDGRTPDGANCRADIDFSP